MKRIFEKNAKIFIPVIIAITLITSLFVSNVLASADGPGFSDGDIISDILDVDKISEKIIDAIEEDEDLLAILDELGEDAKIADMVDAILDEIDEDEILELAAAIVAAVATASGNANIIEVIAEVADAIAAETDISACEFILAVIDAIGEKVLAGIEIELLDKDGIGFSLSALAYLTVLAEYGTDVSFALTVSDDEDLADAADEAAKELEFKIGGIFNLGLVDKDGEAVANVGFAANVVISLPAGDSNSAAYFDGTDITLLPSKVEKGFIYFKAAHFSVFLLLEVEDEDLLVDFEKDAPVRSFTDIEGQWYEDFAKFTGKFIPGIGVKFEGETKLTREEFLATLMNAYGIEIDEEATENFEDIEEDSIYAGYIATAKDLGIAKGIGDNLFGVGAINRQEMFVFLYRVLMAIEEEPEAVEDGLAFEDAADADDVSDFAVEEITALLAANIINGLSDKELLIAPLGGARRAEMAALIYRLFN